MKSYNNKGIIYKTTCLANGKIYVGQDRNNSPHYLGSGSILARAINKYGKHSFIKEILEECKIEDLNDREVFWIKKLDSQNRNVGYNIRGGGKQNTFRNPSRNELRLHALSKGHYDAHRWLVQWYTPEEIMELLKVSPQTLYNWKKTGKIEFVEVSKRNYFYKLPRNLESSIF